MTINGDPGYLFQYTLTAEESRNARRRAQFFRVGHLPGAFAYGLLLAHAPVLIFAGIYSQAMSSDPMLTSMPAISPTMMNQTNSMALLPANSGVTLFICDRGIRMSAAYDAEPRPWDDFTALIWTDSLYLIMTTTEYLAIPKRVVPVDEQRAFEVYGQGMCLKQGISHDFPVIINDKTGFPVQPPNLPGQSSEPPPAEYRIPP